MPPCCGRVWPWMVVCARACEAEYTDETTPKLAVEMPRSLQRCIRLGTTSMTPSRSRNTASCSTSCVREEAAVCAASFASPRCSLASPRCGLVAAADEALRGFEGDLEREFGLAGEAERGDGLFDGVGSAERLTGDLVRPAAMNPTPRPRGVVSRSEQSLGGEASDATWAGS